MKTSVQKKIVYDKIEERFRTVILVRGEVHVLFFDKTGRIVMLWWNKNVGAGEGGG